MKRPKNAAGNADKNTVCSRIFFPLLQTYTTPAPSRRATSLIMDRQLLDHARALGVNVSRAAEARLTAASKEALEAEWKRKNAGAFADYNAYIEENRHCFHLNKLVALSKGSTRRSKYQTKASF